MVPNISLARHAGHPNLIVLRSFGKFFGLAGMRLGFALTGEPLATRLRRALGPWAVSGPAAAIGAVALADDAWARAARVRLTAAAGRLDGLLMRSGLRVVGGTSLFRLVEHRARPGASSSCSPAPPSSSAASPSARNGFVSAFPATTRHSSGWARRWPRGDRSRAPVADVAAVPPALAAPPAPGHG